MKKRRQVDIKTEEGISGTNWEHLFLNSIDRSVAELKQCLDLNTTACRQEDLVVFRDQQKAAVDSFNCGDFLFSLFLL